MRISSKLEKVFEMKSVSQVQVHKIDQKSYTQAAANIATENTSSLKKEHVQVSKTASSLSS